MASSQRSNGHSTPMGKLYSVQVGKPQNYGLEGAPNPHDQRWQSGIYKRPVDGPVFVGRTNLVGDGQSDLKNHGGVDKAVLAYSADHYPEWRRELHLPEMGGGAFGENLTISGLNEELVNIGDLFRVGEVVFEVSQPRQPCWKLARRWRRHELPGLVVQNGRGGWYLRVLQEGSVEAGMPVELVERRNPEWPIARANHILYHRRNDLLLTEELAAVPLLADSWVDELLERAEMLRSSSS
jgi:MOSC domain-containing protein YiiM